MPGIFSRIIAGEIPSYKIAEDDRFFAFLDAFPLRKGHTLVIPKREVDYIFDLPAEEYNGLMLFSRNVAHAVQKAIPCKRCSVHVIGLEVPHAHVHIIPINSTSDCNFANPKLSLSKEEFESTAAAIRAALG